jgi:APA family basic amino acid/polyamine antiporter
MLLVKPLAAGGIAVVFAEHVLQLVGHRFPGETRAVTIAMLVVLTAVNARGVSLSTGVAGVLTALKFAALGGVVLLAAFLGAGTRAPFEPGPAPGTLLAAIVPVMTAVMWTYDGWSDVGAIAGEVKNPSRSLPRVFLLGTAAVTLLYLAVNAAYLSIMPLSEMRGVTNVGPAAFERLLGPAGATVVTVIVVLSTMGSTHGSIMTGARVTFQQSRDGLLFRFLSRVSDRQTPAVALWVQCLLSSVAVIFFETFDRLAGGFVFTMWIFYGLAGAAVFVLRVTQRDAPRPYRVPGYPVVPALFVLSALAMTVLAIRDDWKTTTAWIAVMLAGFPIYLVWRRLAPPTARAG